MRTTHHKDLEHYAMVATGLLILFSLLIPAFIIASETGGTVAQALKGIVMWTLGG